MWSSQLIIAGCCLYVALLLWMPVHVATPPPQCVDDGWKWSPPDVYESSHDIIYVDQANGDDARCPEWYTKYPRMGDVRTACATIDAALAIVRADNQNALSTTNWFIFVDPFVYISEDPVLLPCNVSISSREHRFIWDARGGVYAVDWSVEFCTVDFSNVLLTTPTLYIKAHEFTIYNASISSSNITVTPPCEAALRLKSVSLYNSILNTNASLADMDMCQLSNVVIEMERPRQLDITNTRIVESAIYIHNNASRLRASLFNVDHEQSRAFFDNCHCTDMRVFSPSDIDAIDRECTRQMNLDFATYGLNYQPTISSHWKTHTPTTQEINQ